MNDSLKKNRMLYFFTIFFSIFQAVFLAIFSMRLGAIVDLIGKSDKFLYSILYCIILIVLWFISSSTYSLLKSRYAYSVISDIKAKIYKALYKKEMNDFMSIKNEYYLNMFTKNIDILYDNYLIPKCQIFSDLIFATVSIITIFIISWKLALSFLVISLFSIILSQIPSIIMTKQTNKFSIKSEKYLNMINSHLLGFEQIKLLRLLNNIFSLYEKNEKDYEKSRKELYSVTWIAQSFGILVSFVSQLLCISIGIYFVLNNQLSIGLLIASIQLLNTVFNPIQSFVHNKNLIKTVGEIKSKIDEILNIEETNKLNITEKIRNIDFKNVNIKFGENKIIDIENLEFNLGKTYALMGESGSGKSTSIKLLMKYFNRSDYTGNIFINGEDIENIRTDSLYNKIAYIQRSNFFISDTIENNILLNRKDSLEENIYKNLNLSKEFLTKSINAGNREEISTGEKQRIDIARFLINDYDVLIFDEPTSNLDYETSKMIFDFIFSIKNKIIIVITHETNKEFIDEFDEVIKFK